MRASPPAAWWRRPPAPGASPARADAPGAPRPTGSRIPFWALMGFTFILLLAPQTYVPGLASLRPAFLAGAVAAAAYLADRFIRRQPFVTPGPEVWAVVGLAGWAVVTTPLSAWPGGSLTFLLGFYFKALVIFWLLSHVVTTLARFRAVAWGLSLMAVPLTVVAIRHYRSGRFMEGATDRIVGYGGALTANPNDLALMLNLILPLTVALFLGARRPAVRAALLGIIVLDAAAIVATFSRGGFVTLVAAFLVYAWKLRHRPGRAWIAAAVVLALAALPLVPASYWERLATITEPETDPTGSAQARLSDTWAAIHFVIRNPIVGGGAGMDVLSLNEERGVSWKHVHNVYLQYAVDLGLPGLALFLTLLARCITGAALVHRAGRRNPRGSEPWGLSHLAEGIQVSLIAFAVAALFHPVAYHFYFYYIAGLAMALTTIAVRIRPDPHGLAQGLEVARPTVPFRATIAAAKSSPPPRGNSRG